LLQCVLMELWGYSGSMMLQARALSKLLLHSSRVALLLQSSNAVRILQDSEDRLACWGAPYCHRFLGRVVVCCCGSTGALRFISLYVRGC
jgi:hypothetical protein